MRLVGLVLLGVIIAGAVCLSGCRPAAKPLGVIEIDHRARMIACADSIPLAPCRIEDKGRVIEFKKAEPGPPAEVSWANVNELLQTLAAMGLSFDDQVEVLRRLVRSGKAQAILRETGDTGLSFMSTERHFDLVQKSTKIREGDSAGRILSLLGEPNACEGTRWIYRWHGESEFGIRQEISTTTIEMVDSRVASIAYDAQSISRSVRFDQISNQGQNAAKNKDGHGLSEKIDLE